MSLQNPLRPWAFWRRMQYIGGLLFVLLIMMGMGYAKWLYVPANCFDNKQNGIEQNVDCGGGCARICAENVSQPTTQWARSFKITEGQYNAVAYIENRNFDAGAPELRYTFKLYDEEGLIVERPGVTPLPPDSVYPVFEGRIETGDRVPTRTFIEIEYPEVWLPARSAREQFVIEERTLSNADSVPRLDVSLRNTDLERIKDIEIVATIFDIGKNALTASQTFVPELSGRDTQQIVFTWPEPIATTVRSCELPTDVMLAIDLSGSMNNDGDNPPQPITSVLEAATEFVHRLGKNDQAGVVTYATEAELVSGLSKQLTTAAQTVNQLVIDPESEQGSTNTGDAIVAASQELMSDRHNKNARKVLVLLTDGLANEPEENPEQYAIDAATSLKAADTEIYTIGLGGDVNEDFLRTIASDDEHYYRAASADTVDTIYRTITGSLCENGVAIIEIIPKLPVTFEGE